MESNRCRVVDGGDYCVFCNIANGTDPNAEILCQDEEVVCFKDISPAAPHHYLVVPRLHIEDCSELRPEHTALVVRMANMGLAALQANNVTDFSDIRLGFHIPPAISVPHLHLHVLAPRSRMYEDAIERCLVTASYSFITVLLHELCS
ncbi:adenosine 5'-monophosphoramidase HINT3-like isoform X2 [Sardina pilchardus]|uniref:adenosine 5'-monophosphoramidase HINT3-like isoform X2 n=1 Tax=Sardina pilchardus TaxID=27697 RepID=UPI002E1116AB